MLSFPNCKINLGLNIISKREDGYHDLETVFIPVPFTDILEIIPADKSEFTISGIPLNTENNLCINAYNLLKQDFPNLPYIQMHLHKVIPLGAGLGGGSSDAAFTLQLLNDKFKLNLNTQQLIDYALQLGSDCPFFIINKPCFATSRGEKLQNINLDLNNYQLLIVNPGIHIDTKWAFSKITAKQPDISIQEIINQPIEVWKDKLKNDFEFPVFAEYPEILKIKNDLYSQGAIYASLSGSGSTIFSIFSRKKNIQFEQYENYFNKIINFS